MRNVMVPSGTPLAFCQLAPLLVLVSTPSPTMEVPPKPGSPVPAIKVWVDGRKAMAPTSWVGRGALTECQAAPPLVVSQTPPVDEAAYPCAGLAGAWAKLWIRRERFGTPPFSVRENPGGFPTKGLSPSGSQLRSPPGTTAAVAAAIAPRSATADA